MISSLTALFIIFAVVIGSTAMVGVFAYILSRVRRLESGGGGAGAPPVLEQQVARLQAEVEAMRDDVSTLTERLDFTERLLMKGEDAGGEHTS